jgi:maleamate amidohydrolase
MLVCNLVSRRLALLAFWLPNTTGERLIGPRDGERTVDADETHHIYERAGIGHRICRGNRPGVLVVDFSAGFTDPRYPTGADLSVEVTETRRLLDVARDRGRPVYFTTIAYGPGLRDGGVWLQKMPGLGSLVAGTPPVALNERLDRRADEPLIVKKGASAFFGTNLAALLAADGIDTLIVCGATTSGCVRASVVDAVQSGFPVLVPRECVGDRAAAPHDANLFDIDAKYGDVVSVEDALGYLAECQPVTA